MVDVESNTAVKQSDEGRKHVFMTAFVGILFLVSIIMWGVMVNGKDSPMKGDDDEHWDVGQIDSFGSVTGKITTLESAEATISAGTVTTLAATGKSTLADAAIATADIDGGSVDGATIGATTASTGAFTTLSATGKSTLADAAIATADIDGGSVDGTTIGATTASTGAFTTLSATGKSTIADAAIAKAQITTLSATGKSTIADADIATADSDGGSVDGTTIGATTASTGAFTTLSATGKSTIADADITTADIDGGSVDGATIGATTASTGAFTTLSATGKSTLADADIATADIDGGSVDGTTIGASITADAHFKTVTAASVTVGVRPVVADYVIKESDSYVISLKGATTLTLPKANLVAGMLLTVVNGASGANAGPVTLQVNGGALASITYGTHKVGTAAMMTGSCMAGNFIGLDSDGCSAATATSNYGVVAHYDLGGTGTMYYSEDAANTVSSGVKYCCWDHLGHVSAGDFTTNSAPNPATANAGQGGILGDATGSDTAATSIVLTKGSYTTTTTLASTLNAGTTTGNTNSGGNHNHPTAGIPSTSSSIARSALSSTVGTTVTLISDGSNWHVVSTGARDTFGA